MTRPTVGFVGLGAMGAPMARNVADAGYPLVVWNRTRETADAFAEDVPADVASTPRELAERADVVITMVTDGDAVLEVLEGSDGVLAGLDDGDVVVEMSTVGPESTEMAAELVRAAGGRFVDSPVSGTVGPAESGTLTILAAGDDDDLDAVRPILEAMGEPIIECGDVGAGTDMKLFVNLLLGDAMQAFAEAMVFGKARGLDIDDMLDVVGSGGLDAPLFQAKGEMIRRGEFDPQFPVDLLFKDMSLALDAAGDSAVPMPATAAAREAVNGARAGGHGDEDMAAVVKFLEDATGVEVRDE